VAWISYPSAPIAFGEVKAALDAFYALGKTVVSRMLVRGITCSLIAFQTSDGAFQACQAMLDFSDVIFDSTDVDANGSEVLKDQIFNIFGHLGRPIGARRG
jgi:hypothetical protein